ncbi:DUF3990 domain-containing protein [Bacteroides sp. OttesenSCG-928-N06]|nr:DUF3990 domain-containing protein [Bacteroides sp. OttesenSCG-928-N06]
MRVYHGSYVKIDKIDLSLCRPNRDFGQGFYVTKFHKHAQNWSINVSRRHKKSQPIITEFEYSENAFTQSICKIKRFEKYDEAWLDFVVMNRNENNPTPAHNYDIVEGPVADDKVQNRIDAYLEGKISKADFLKELKYHEETHQICFCTLNSLQALDYVDKTHRRSITDISEPLIEQLMMDKKTDEIEATDIFYTSKTYTQLADVSTLLYQKPWQEIYEMLRKELQIRIQ